MVVDDDLKVQDILREFLQINGYDVMTCGTGEEALDVMVSLKPSLIFLDVKLPGMDGIEVQKEMLKNNIEIPVIVMTSFSSMNTAIQSIRLGAYDYLRKPFNFGVVQTLTEKCLAEHQYKLESGSEKPSRAKLGGKYELSGSSPAMIEVYKTIGSVARTGNFTNVLILGESGTGKELVSRQVHMWSSNSAEPFIGLNVTALPDMLIESELFGHEKGAFTGADSQKIGKFEQAGEGTIFLDEIGGISQDLQQKLLRVLQEREFFRLGGRDLVPVKCRIIAATNDDLKAKVASGEFRKDMYFRLKVVSVHMPPLRDRPEDIPRLADIFIQRYAQELGQNLPTLTKETIVFLCSYDWPGNVRELENAIAQAMVFNRSDRIMPQDFPELEGSMPFREPTIKHKNLEKARQIFLDEFEKNFVKEGLRHTLGNVNEAAISAGISTQRFYQLMKKHDIKAGTYKRHSL